MKFHSVCELFPRMSQEEFDELQKDIAANGLREPIWTFEDQIIDGRHRFEACENLARAPKFRRWDGSEDGLLPFVVSLNLRRRHLSIDQLAMVAARIANYGHGGTRQSKPPAGGLTSTRQAAMSVGATHRSTERAARVHRQATKKVIDAVDSGEMTLASAEDAARLPVATQNKIVDRVKKGESPRQAVRHFLRPTDANDIEEAIQAYGVELSNAERSLKAAITHDVWESIQPRLKRIRREKTALLDPKRRVETVEASAIAENGIGVHQVTDWINTAMGDTNGGTAPFWSRTAKTIKAKIAAGWKPAKDEIDQAVKAWKANEWHLKHWPNPDYLVRNIQQIITGGKGGKRVDLPEELVCYECGGYEGHKKGCSIVA